MKKPGARYGTRGRVPTYIGGASPIGTCMYGNGNTYGKGKASLTAVQLSRTSLRYLGCGRTSLHFVKAEAHTPRCPFELQNISPART